MAFVVFGIPGLLYIACYYFPGGKQWLSKHGLYY